MSSQEDISLCSSDGVLYRVSTSRLGEATTLLEHHDSCSPLTIPAPSSIVTPALLMVTGQSTRLADEDSPFYFKTLAELESAVALLHSWGAEGALGLIRSSLSGYLALSASVRCDASPTQDPAENEEVDDQVVEVPRRRIGKGSIALRLFGIAYKMDWEEESEEFALHAQSVDIWDDKYSGDVEKIGSLALMSFMKRRRERRDVFMRMFDDARHRTKAAELANGKQHLTFGVPTTSPFACSKCEKTVQFENSLLEVREKMFLELDSYPRGDTLFNALIMDDWLVAKRLWALKCGCEKEVVDRLRLLRDVKQALKMLDNRIHVVA